MSFVLKTLQNIDEYYKKNIKSMVKLKIYDIIITNKKIWGGLIGKKNINRGRWKANSRYTKV